MLLEIAPTPLLKRTLLKVFIHSRTGKGRHDRRSLHQDAQLKFAAK